MRLCLKESFRRCNAHICVWGWCAATRHGVMFLVRCVMRGWWKWCCSLSAQCSAGWAGKVQQAAAWSSAYAACWGEWRAGRTERGLAQWDCVRTWLLAPLSTHDAMAGTPRERCTRRVLLRCILIVKHTRLCTGDARVLYSMLFIVGLNAQFVSR